MSEDMYETIARSFNYDRGLKIGDIISAYHKGYHRVTAITPRYVNEDKSDYLDRYSDVPKEGFKQSSSLISYEQVLTNALKPAPKRRNQCDAFYCKKLDATKLIEERDSKIYELEAGYKILIDLVDPE